MKPEISVVIPVKNEEKNIAILYKELVLSLKNTKKRFEIIFVEDGSTDSSFYEMKKIHRKDKRVKIIKLRGNWGKSVALQTGFDTSKGNIIFTLDGDLQDDPKEIPNFIKKLKEGFDLVSGWKKKRLDSSFKVIPSKILNNFLIPLLAGVKLHDNNCGFKLYKKEVIKNLNLYGELYRFIPILAAKQNFKVGEIIIRHRHRKYGKSKFGLERNFKGFLDLITVVFLTSYLKRPAHFFGGFGLLFFSGGFLIGLYITYLRITTGGIGYHQPLLIFGILLMIVGVQLLSTGLIAEMFINLNQGKDTHNYIEEKLV